MVSFTSLNLSRSSHRMAKPSLEPRFFQRHLELLAKMKSVRDLGEGIVPGEPVDLLLCVPFLGDVLLQIDPTSAGDGLVGDEDDAAVLQLLHVGKGFAARELVHVVVDPLALLLERPQGARDPVSRSTWKRTISASGVPGRVSSSGSW